MNTLTWKKAVAVSAATALGALLSACGSDDASAESAESGELRIFSYEMTLAESTLTPFEEAHPDLDVRGATFESNDEAAAKIKSGFRADLIEVCLDEQGPLVDAGLLAPIDTSKLDHWDDLDPTFRDASGITTEEGVTMVPIRAGAEGLIYDKDAFPDGVDSWASLFDPALDGRVALDGGYWLTPFAIVALANGNQDPMNLSDEEVAAARDQLIEARDHFRAYSNSEADKLNMFKSGEIVLTDGGPQAADEMVKDGMNVAWANPSEGALSWVCGLSISSEAENVDAAYAFINDYTSPQTQATIGNDGFVMINPKGVPMVDEEHKEGSDPGALEGAHPEVAPANAELWREYWQEVKAE